MQHSKHTYGAFFDHEVHDKGNASQERPMNTRLDLGKVPGCRLDTFEEGIQLKNELYPSPSRCLSYQNPASSMSRSASGPRITVITCYRAACGAIRLSPLTKDARLGDWRQAAPNARELLPSANRGLLPPQGEPKSAPKAIERTRPARPQKGCRTPVAELVLRVPCLMPPVRLYHHEARNTTYSACRTREHPRGYRTGRRLKPQDGPRARPPAPRRPSAAAPMGGR